MTMRRHGLPFALLSCIALSCATAAFPAAASAQDAKTDARPVWTTLGTSCGPIPNPGRAQPANLLRAGDRLILIDVGDGATDQIGKAGIPFETVDTLFISHHHFDHIGGLGALIGRRYQVAAANVLTIYGPPGTKAIVEELVGAVDAASLGGAVVREKVRRSPADMVKVVEIADGDTVSLGDMTVIAAANSHYVALASGAQGPQPQSLSFRFNLPGRSIVYTGDTGPSENVEKLARGADLLISEIIDPDAALARIRASRPDLPENTLKLVGDHYRAEHLTPTAVGELAARAKVRALVITHNPIVDAALDTTRQAIAAVYKGPITIASDLDNF
ncbi:MAG: MBL fold metallo-hydrolase [Sphingobium sp.]